jgi:Carboxypeptidase regulatory-like domain
MKLHLCLALPLFLLQVPGNPTAPQQAGKASIEGTVTRSGSGEPLERAQVTLNRLLPPPSPLAPGQTAAPITPPPPIAPVLTPNDGKFKFEVEPGQYRLRVQRNGYATQEYGQRVMGGAGTTINLTAGQAMRDVQFKMTPAAVVTGRVRDFRGEPITGVQVSLLRSIYNVQGQRTLSSVAGSMTDDRGEYRVFWVPPGRYIVSVAAQTSSLLLATLGGQTFFVDRNFPTTYYPGTAEASRAVTLDVPSGREVTGIDVVVNPPPTYRIRGRVIDGTTGQPPRTAGLSLTPRLEAGSSDVFFLPSSLGNSTTYNPNGTFEIRNVIPGTYWLRAQMTSNLDDPLDPSIVANARTASDLLDTVLGGRANRMTQIPIDVAGDLQDVALTLTPGISVQMRLSVEGQELSSVGGYDRIRVNLRPTVQGVPFPSQRSAFSAEGIGSIDNVQAGDYRIQIGLAQQPDLYLKEASFERTDVLNNPWQITSRTSGTLTIVLSNKAGQIEGNLTDALSQPVSGNQVVLIPDQMRDRPELLKSAVTDQSGHFTFRGIAPGGYKVFSWEAIEPNAWYDRELLSQYEQQGRTLRIQEGSKETIDLKVIPAPK